VTAAADQAQRVAGDESDILTVAAEQVLERGEGLDEAQILRVLRLPDDRLSELLDLAHQVRMRWCGPEVEVEGIVSVKTGGCPEDCHFCSQSGRFPTPVRAAWLDIPGLVEAAKQTAATGATEFCIVAAVRGPDTRLMSQVRDGIKAIREAGLDINIACSLGMLTQEQVDELVEMGVHRYNHNLETARSNFRNVVTTHDWEERWETLRMVAEAGIQVCCGGIIGIETDEQRAEFAAQLAELGPHEVPMNFLIPQPGTPYEHYETVQGKDALRTVAAFRLAMPKTMLRFAGGRELTLGDLGAEQGMLGGVNAIIVGNYLTNLGRPANADLEMLDSLHMPIKALNETL
jgi:biotin synthase